MAKREGLFNLTRRGVLGGLAAGVGSVTLSGTGSAGDKDPQLYVNWDRLDVDDAYPKDGFRSRDEFARAEFETKFAPLNTDQRLTIDEKFRRQFPNIKSSPFLDLSSLEPGSNGALEFTTHILDAPLMLWLTVDEIRGGSWKWLNSVDATLRFADSEDAVILSGTLLDIIAAATNDVLVDGNRSYGDVGPFDPDTEHKFVLEWSVPSKQQIPKDPGWVKFAFTSKEARAEKTGRKRQFSIHAIDVEISYSTFGTRNPQGAMFVLEENLEAVRDAEGELPSTPGVDTSVIEPLVIRANEGDIVEITFVNDLDRPASIHPTGIAYNVDESDGMKVGFNDNSVADPGETVTYTWFAAQQGAYFFKDGAFEAWDSTPDNNPEAVNSMARHLFGAIIVEPPEATWTDPKTGAPLRSGVRADIHLPEFPDHREFIWIYHDHGRVVPELNIPDTNIEQTLHGINYRATRTSERIGETGLEPGTFYSSWVHGDPGGGDNVWEAYQGDPVKTIIVGANPEENHVHHLHEHRWNRIPFREDSDTLDSQNLSMGAGFTQFLTVASGPRSLRPEMDADEAFTFGAGGFHGGIGDILFHCHMFPHYGEGMNGILRVHNKRQPLLQPLPNNEPPLAIDVDVLGFPDFIPAEEGEMPPKPPFSQPLDPREPTPEEEAALPALIPGAPYTDPCHTENTDGLDPDPTGDDIEAIDPDIVYDVVAIPTKLVYNDHGDYDPEGKVFVLEKDVKAVLSGSLMPEPLFLRANVGDCIEVNVRNDLDLGTSAHVHFVGFDQLASDSATVGYNYDQETDPGDTMTYRWFADEEGVIFMHDHITGIGDVMHGEFGALIVEPEGSAWLDPHTGEPIRDGSQAIIDPPNGEAFREFCLSFHDFAPLIDPSFQLDQQPDDPEDEAFVNPHEQHGVNAGVGAINYRNAPYYRRGPDPDPAYVHSSFVHGDPETPTLETYPDDKVRIRLVHGPYEEQHNFSLHGLRLEQFGFNPESNVSQIMATSEAFTFEVREAERHDFDLQPNAADLPIRDYLYGSMISHDLWDGMWGILRVFGAEVDHLFPLPDQKPPSGMITEKELREMGHPAVFDRRGEIGHRVKLTFDQATTDPTQLPDTQRRRNENIDGNPPPDAPTAGDPCPESNRTLTYDISALQTQIEFNEYGDHDPHGIVFRPDELISDTEKSDSVTDPLLIRGNERDCLEINLTNALPKNPDDHDDHPQMRTPEEDLPIQWVRSNRISLHSNQLIYDVNGSDGATVGFNFDQTIGPGESITYRWFADEKVEPGVLWDMADIRSNRHHGAFGQVIVEPEGSKWFDSRTGEPTKHSRAAIIIDTEGEEFREFALSMSDARYIINDDGMCVVPVNPDDPDQDPDRPCNQIGDPEDQGYLAFNNRAEPFRRRFETNDDRQDRVYDSEIHGDPATPIFTAHVGDRIRFRLGQMSDASRGISFHLANHVWERFKTVPESPMIGVDGQFSPGRGFSLDLDNGAGGAILDTGDFIYKEMKERRRLEAGAWGIFRVIDFPPRKKDKPRESTAIQPLPHRSNSLSLSDRPGWVVTEGDLRGLGETDLVIGIPRSDRGAENGGAVYLFYGKSAENRSIDLSTADSVFVGQEKGMQLGQSVSIESKQTDIGTARTVTMKSADGRFKFDGKKSYPPIVKLDRGDGI